MFKLKNMEEEKNKQEFKDVQFPNVKNIHARTLAQDIIPMSSKQVRNAMREMFEKFENETGYKPVILGNNFPTRVFFPKENIQQEEE